MEHQKYVLTTATWTMSSVSQPTLGMLMTFIKIMEEKCIFTLNGLRIFFFWHTCLALVPVFGDITIRSSIPSPSSTNLIFTKTEKQ